MGGRMAASYAAKNAESLSGLVLLGAYSSKDLTQSGLPVLSITAELDTVVDENKMERNRENLPEGHLGENYRRRQSLGPLETTVCRKRIRRRPSPLRSSRSRPPRSLRIGLPPCRKAGLAAPRTQDGVRGAFCLAGKACPFLSLFGAGKAPALWKAPEKPGAQKPSPA